MASLVPNINPNASGSDTDDSDFAASDSYGSDYESSSSEPSVSRSKSKGAAGLAEEALASGDEGVVESGKRKRKKKHKKKDRRRDEDREGAEALVNEEDEGYEAEEGVGARLRRRREGRVERYVHSLLSTKDRTTPSDANLCVAADRETKKKSLGTFEAATIDVDDLWQRLATAPTESTAPPPPAPDTYDEGNKVLVADEASPSVAPAPNVSADMISIKRTYIFAGETTTEEKLVPRESAEARLFLSSKPDNVPKSPTQDSSSAASRVRRPLRRPSRFDDPNPAPTSLLQTTASIKSHLAPTAVNTAGMSAVQKKLEQGQKLNTVEKSKLDWAGYVDKEKLKDELDMAEKAKGSYLDRMDFLGRSEQARDDVIREGRRK